MITSTELITFLKNKTVAVIGNSEQVTEYDYGSEIEEFDVVIRMNRFNVSEEYVKSTGIKTDILVTNFWKKVTPNVKIMEEFDIKYIFSSLPDRPGKYFPKEKEFERNLEQATKKGWDKHFPKMHRIDTEYLDMIGDLCIKKRPSSGILVLCWLLDKVDFKLLFSTGLSFGENKWHYNQQDYGNVGPMKKHHNPHGERYALKSFMELNPNKKVMFDPLMTEVLENTS